MARSKEEAKEYMRAWRRRKRAGLPNNPHVACDTRITELEAIIAAQNVEIGELKSQYAALALVYEIPGRPAEPDELDSVL